MSFENPKNPFTALESDPAPFDISDKVAEIFAKGGLRVAVELMRYVQSLADRPHLSLTLNYFTLDHAKWVKAFVAGAPSGQERMAYIRATESQAKEAANVFASGVEWIKVEE